MKNVLALAISLLLPAIPVLADVAPDPAQQAAAADARMTANADKTQKLLLADSPDAPAVPTGVPVDRTPPAQTAPAPQKQSYTASGVANHVDPVQQEKKPSFVSGMKAKLMGIMDKHPLLVGMLLGGLIGAVLAGPFGFVIGASLGAVGGDVAHHYLKKH